MSAHKWAEVIKAWADGKAIQYRTPYEEEWKTYIQTGSFGPWKCRDCYEWRIKPERWYRVSMMGNSTGTWTETVDSGESDAAEASCESDLYFKGWLTDRVYY